MAQKRCEKPLRDVLQNVLSRGLSHKLEAGQYAKLLLFVRAERVLQLHSEVLNFILSEKLLRTLLAEVLAVGQKKRKSFNAFSYIEIREYLYLCRDKKEAERKAFLRPKGAAAKEVELKAKAREVPQPKALKNSRFDHIFSS